MIAVDMDQKPPVFDEENRLWNPERIYDICGSLVRVDLNPDGRNSLGEPEEVQTLTIAHTTVLDFLKTQPIKISSEPEVRFTQSIINLRMAETCLVYLRYFIDNHIELTKNNIIHYPLARFCAEFWHEHYRKITVNGKEEVNMTQINAMVMALFHSREALLKWVRLYDPCDHTNRVDLGKQLSEIHTPIYYASLLGLSEVVSCLINEGATINDTFDECNGNLCLGTPLVAASSLGRNDTVSLLLEKGADPNLSGPWFWGFPLASAVQKNQAEIVKMLLKRKDIDINCRRGCFQPENVITATGGEDDTEYRKFLSRESMVYIAATYSSLDVLEILLEAGADPNIEGGAFHTALQAACYFDYSGNTVNVERLLAAGSHVNQKGGLCGSALYAACSRQKEDLVRLLLDSGADPNIQECGKCDNALQRACSYGNEKIVRLLLERGADPNLYGGHFGSAFHAGCFSGNEPIVRLLLEKGVDTKHRGGAYETPLKAAIENGSDVVVKFLLDSGESVNEKEGIFSYPVVKALLSEHNDPLLRILLENGANPNQELEGKIPLVGGYKCWSSTPLQLAHAVSTTALLLDYGASINEQAGYFGTALHAAIRVNKTEQGVAELLISRGADVNSPHWRHGTPLELACRLGDREKVKLLLDNGAKLEELDMSGQSPLSKAICCSQLTIVDRLIDLGANPNVLDKRGCSYLHYAARACNSDCLRKILSFGLDINGVDSNGWSPLHWAASSGYGSARSIKTLLKAGSNKDLKDKQGRTALDLATLCGKNEEANILKTDGSAYGDLPETNDGKTLRPYGFECDVCEGPIHAQNSKGFEYRYRCTTCIDFDLCFRCVLDKDIIHPKDHEFTVSWSLYMRGLF